MPADPHRVTVLRRIEALTGPARMRIALDVQAGFGAHRMRDLCRSDDGVWTARCGPLQVRWVGAGDAHPDGSGALRLDLTVPEGESHDLVLDISDVALSSSTPADQLWTDTEAAWRNEIPSLAVSVASRDAHHAYAVLRGLTSRSGGMVAAATMSLPERAANGTNYDYRYVWIRDQCYTGVAVAAAGPHPLLGEALRFVTARLLADGDGLKPAYTVDGGMVPPEERLDLPGYPGAADVRGNHASEQFQLDAFGEALQLVAAGARHGWADGDCWRAADIAVNAIERHWTEPDAGVWELDSQWWTHSRLSCVAGLTQLADRAPASSASRLRRLASVIRDEVAARCAHRAGHWQRTPGDSRTDAALLLPLVRGAWPTSDPRWQATIAQVRRELVDDGYVYRYKPDGQRLGEAEGAFLLCGFILALAEAASGNPVGAFRHFERNRAACGTPGLFAEEFDVGQRQLRGNLPQAFVHGLLLECATRLSEPPS
jgi:GH15 family glucan-1,4-alpha-glucosidase